LPGQPKVCKMLLLPEKFPFSLIVDAPRLAKFATAFELPVTILPPCPRSPRAILAPEPATLRFLALIVLKSP